MKQSGTISNIFNQSPIYLLNMIVDLGNKIFSTNHKTKKKNIK